VSLARVAPGVLVPGELVPPESKSDAQRALVLRSVRGLPPVAVPPDAPEDTQHLAKGLEVLAKGGGDVHVGDGGAPLRFLLTQAALTPGARTAFHGSERLAARPHGPLVDALLAALKSDGLSLEWNGQWPLVVQAPAKVSARTFRVDGAQSSQYASSLLLGAAKLAVRTSETVSVAIDGKRASEGYLELTLDWLRATGFTLSTQGGRISVSPRSAPPKWPDVPGDWSSGAALLALAWKCGGSVRGLPKPEAHPDGAIVGMLTQVGLAVSPGKRWQVSGAAQRGLDVSVQASPDLALVLAALACVLPGESVLRDVAVLRAKESDRAAGVLELVRAAGGQGEARDDRLVLTPPREFKALRFDAQRDHRRAMGAAVLAVLAGVELELEGAEHVKKSFPGFWQQLARTGARVTVDGAPV